MLNAYSDVTAIKSDAYLGFTPTTEDEYLRKLLEQSSRLIDNWTGRFFYCREGALYFDGSTNPLCIGDILSITTLKTDDDEDATFENSYTEDTDYRLYPLNDFPKTKIKIMSAGSYSGFASGVDKGIEIIGVFGYGDGVDATPYYASGQVVRDNPLLAASTTITTLSTATLGAGMTLCINLEQVYIVSITNATTFVVVRAVNGTSVPVVDHPQDTAMSIYEYPLPIVQACLITSMRAWKRKDSAYQDVVGGGALGTVITSKGIDPDVAETIGQYRVYKL